MEQEQWTSEIMGSLNGMQRAQLPDGLRQKLEALGRRRIVRLSAPVMWLMAAGLALLIGLNIVLVSHRERGDNHQVAQQQNPIADDYFAPPPSI